jgi:hypothetical protein
MSMISLNSSTMIVSNGTLIVAVGEISVAEGGTPFRSTMPRVTFSVHDTSAFSGVFEVERTELGSPRPPGIVSV